MATFVIEMFVSAARPADLEHAVARLTEAARPPIRLVRSFYLRDDETCFYIIEAPSMEAAVELSRLAGVKPDRIMEAQAADA